MATPGSGHSGCVFNLNGKSTVALSVCRAVIVSSIPPNCVLSLLCEIVLNAVMSFTLRPKY